MNCNKALLILIVLTTFCWPLSSMAESDHSHWLLRTTALGVLTDSESSGPLDLDTDDTVDGSFDATYFVTPHIAINVVATVLNLEVDTGSGTLAAALGSGNLGSVDLVPPIVTLQWHLFPQGRLRPYLGAGFNYNIFYGESGNLDAVDAEIEDTFGFAAVAGMDYMLNKHFSLNLDFKYLTFETDVDVKSNSALDDELEVDAFLLGVGFGYRF